MARPRTPVEKAEITGQARHNRQRYAGRPKSPSEPIGEPPSWMNEQQAAAFESLKGLWDWVTEKDRPAFEMAAKLYARMMNDPTDEMGTTSLNLLRLIIGQFGGNPTDFSKINAGEDDEPDPADRFFN